VPAVPGITRPFGKARGVQEPFAIANPAAAADGVFTVDGRGLRRLVSIVFTLTTSADVADRYVTVEYEGGDGLPFAVNAAGVLVTALSTQRFAGSISRGNSEWNTGTDVLFPLEDVFLYPSNVLRINVAAVQATDALSGIRGVLERFPLDWYDLPTLID
jgi:hypothetical protein